MSDHATVLAPGHYHHFEPEQAYHASKLAMWLFLATEILFFGGLFCTFAVFHWKYYELFHENSQHLNTWLGAINTAVLLTSSFFMALGVDAAQRGQNGRVIRNLSITLACGFIFLVIKYFEYSEKLHHGLYPRTNLYFGLYYTMTGLHGIHVLGGLVMIAWLMLLARRKLFTETYYTPVEVIGLYWHLVDLIWIYLFPLLYLIK